MKRINKIVIHCSATRENTNYSFEQLKRDHLKRGFRDVGYNVYITKDGKAYLGRALGEQLAHAKGHNDDSFAICYEGGLDYEGKPKDTRTIRQKTTLLEWVLALRSIIPDADVIGHRDLSPDLNGDGVITRDEFMKQCPCFDVGSEYKF